MDIKDVCYFGILNSQKKVLYSYNYGNIEEKPLFSTLDEGNGPFYLYNNQTVFVTRLNDITLMLLTMPDSNEIFVQKAFESLINSLTLVVKNWCEERVAEKYDQILLVVNEFVFKGIILTDESSELSSRVLKRSFETTSAIKVNKGFASFLNKATKSFRK